MDEGVRVKTKSMYKSEGQSQSMFSRVKQSGSRHFKLYNGLLHFHFPNGWVYIDTTNLSVPHSRIKNCKILITYEVELRAALHYGGEVHRSWILGEFYNLIGREQHTWPVVVYTTSKSPLVENIVHGWRNDNGCQHGDTFLKGSSLEVKLGNLKALNKKLDLRRTPTWIKYFIVFSISPAFHPCLK